MTELLCIQTHSQKAVLAGHTYLLISDKSPCNCMSYDVGIPFAKSPDYNGGRFVICEDCGIEFPHNNIWWLSPELFAKIATEEEVKEQESKLELQEV